MSASVGVAPAPDLAKLGWQALTAAAGTFQLPVGSATRPRTGDVQRVSVRRRVLDGDESVMRKIRTAVLAATVLVTLFGEVVDGEVVVEGLDAG